MENSSATVSVGVDDVDKVVDDSANLGGVVLRRPVEGRGQLHEEGVFHEKFLRKRRARTKRYQASLKLVSCKYQVTSEYHD